ncbi:unnamed protein product [Paramecium sonneborni]|uniref:Transmembrane protein n=1 Tax=Paramecium sonneborni TaxID=65129 RepID=A0A8S1NVX7_9CILI|nr:unnamed protein product [Paramecium sonneborni]
MDKEIIQFQDKNQELESFSQKIRYTTLDKNNQNRMKELAIGIKIILIIQTLFIGIIFGLNIYLNIQFSWPYETFLSQALYIRIFFLTLTIIFIIRLLIYRLRNNIAQCNYQLYKQDIFIVIFIAAYLIFFISLSQISNIFDLQGEKLFNFYIYQVLLTLFIGYIYNLIYFSLAQDYIERKVQCSQAVIIIIEVIVYILVFIGFLSNQSDQSDQSDYFQRIVSILFLQGVITLYLHMQIHLLFKIINGKLELKPNQYFQGYLYIQITTFLVCFKD